MAKKIGDVYVRVHFKSNGRELRDDVEKDPEFKKAGESAGGDFSEAFEEQLEPLRKSIHDHFENMSKEDENWLKTHKTVITKWRQDELDRIAESDRLNRGWFKRFRDGMSRVDEDWRKSNRSSKGFIGVLHKVNDATDDVGDTIGRVFGKGSRNDFINFFGSFVGNLASLPGTLIGAFANVGDVFKRIQKGFQESETFAEGLGTAVAELGPAAAGAIAGGLIALPFILGLVSSAVMLLTGAVIALAGALSFALIGAIGAVAGALVPLAAGIGVAILAFKGMTKEQKGAFSGIGDEFNKLSKVAAAHLFKNAGEDAKTFSSVLDGLLPIVAGVADALRIVGEMFLKAMSGPGAKKFVDFLAQVLPGMIKQIGQIALNLGTFLGEAFVAVTPLVKEFLGWLGGVTQALADTGKGGKKSKLADFFSTVGPIMDQVGDAIAQVAGLITDLFSAGAGTGGDMFQSLADNVKKFRDFLAQAKKDGSLQEFFDDAKKFGGAIGEAVVQVGKLIAALDTPEGRKILIFMVREFTAMVRFITDFVELEAKLLHGIVKAGQAVGKWFGQRWKDIPKVWHAMVEGTQKAWQAIKNAFSNIGQWFKARWESVTNAATTAWGKVKAGATNTKDWIQARVDDIVGFFRGLPGRISDLAGGFLSAGKDLGNAVLNGIKNAFNAATGFAGDIASSVGAGIRNVINGLINALNNAIPNSLGKGKLSIDLPDNPISPIATGGLIKTATLGLVGEAGPEAVVPLTGPLSRVDPAVRELSRIARGQTTVQATGRGGKSIDVGGITIITPTKDPKAVAQQVVNRIAAVSYI